MKTYVVKSPIRHDGKRYEVGFTIDLSEDAARPLLERGRIEAVPAKADAKPASAAPEAPPAPVPGETTKLRGKRNKAEA